MKQSTLDAWIVTGFIEPTNSNQRSPGAGNHRRFNLRDLTAICAAAELRRQGVDVRIMRQIQMRLRAYQLDLASARLALLRNGEDGVTDVVLIESTESARKKLAISMFNTPGQYLLVELPLAPVARKARSAFKKVRLEKPAIRGTRSGSNRAADG